MSAMSEKPPRSLGILTFAISLCLLSFLAAIATAFGAIIWGLIAVEGADATLLVWLAWMVMAFILSVTNFVWSLRLGSNPTPHGVLKITLVSLFALISFATMKAATT